MEVATARASDREIEAFEELMWIAHRRTGAIPSELIASKVMSVTEGGDWPLRQAALDALLRRFTFARRDELIVARRPRGTSALGIYETRRKGSGGRGRRRPPSRPYRTLLLGVEPLAGSCDCPDYQRSGLGLCKHLLVVLDELAGKPKKWSRARQEQSRIEPRTEQPRLVWDPVRPLTGPGDWLQRVGWLPGMEARGRSPGGRTAEAASRWFTANDGGPATLAGQDLEEPAIRTELVEDLQRFLRYEVRRARSGLPSDPVLAPLLEDERARLRQAAELQPVHGQVKGPLKTLKRRVYPYQLEGVQRFLERGVHLLADDMGLGKTVEAIAACHVLWHQGRVSRGLIVVPASLKTQWQREWQAWTDIPVQVVDGSPKDRAAIYHHSKQGFLVANYEQVLRDLPLMHRFRPELMVLDEAQRIKNWATKTAAYIKQLKPPLRLVLTGTPMENRLEELASIMDWVDDRAIEPKWRLGPWHAVAAGGRKEIGGARNLQTLRTRMAHCLTRRVRQEVLDQLPPRTDTRIPVPMTEDQQSAHDELNQPIAQLLARAKKRPLTQAEFLRLMQLLTAQRILCNGLAQHDFEQMWPAIQAAERPNPRLLDRLQSPKLVEFRELVGQIVLEQRRKVVVFSQWRRMLKLAHWAVRDLLGDEGLRAVFFTGQERQRRRTHNVVDFHDDQATCMLLCSDAGGVGLNLQRAASCTVCLDLPWNPAVLEQRVGRIYRLGQKEPVEVYHLVSETGIESRIAGLIGDKQALFKGLFDGSSDEVRFDRSGSFISRLERIMEPVEVPELGDEVGDEVGDEEEAEALGSIAERPIEPALQEPVQATAATGASPVLVKEAAIGGAEQLSGARIRSMLSSIEVRRNRAGGITIEAPPEAAETLASMFSGMAELLTRTAHERGVGP
ncbi:MAG: DEAD/DEAH box helicase [Deltaproteobacteria bacterium]|nr:DEAD/DEAH box helicase [Deltaproteobacteria bacterium]